MKAGDSQRFTDAVSDAVKEYDKARTKFAPYKSAHEGYAVILEELDELWDEVRAHDHDRVKMRAEAIQVASTALAFAAELCND